MKTIIIALLVILLISTSTISSTALGAFAVIGRTGLSFISPEAAHAVNTVICISNPVLCAQGKIVGAVAGELYQEIARQSPEAARAIATYNQIDSYLQTGASIVQELKVDSDGYITEGTMDFTQQKQIGNLVGKNINKEDIIVSNTRFAKNNGISVFTLHEEGNIIIKEKDQQTNKVKGRIYSNIVKGGILKVDENGRIMEADMTSNDKGSTLSFADKVVEVPPDTRVTFKDGKIKVYGNDKTFSLSNFGSQQSSKIRIIEGDEITIAGSTVTGRAFEGENFKVAGYGSGLGQVTIAGGKITNVGSRTNAVIEGIEHKVYGERSLNIYYDEDFSPPKNGENYFAYGKEKVWLGGGGFTSSLRKGNSVFPEYIENLEKGSLSELEGRLEFTPKNAQLEITKISPQKNPLALNIKSRGSFNINNGKWVLEGDGDNVYAGIKQEPPFGIAAEITIDNVGTDGMIRQYHLEPVGTYKGGLSQTAKDTLNLELNSLKLLRDQQQQNYATSLAGVGSSAGVIELDKKIGEVEEDFKKLNARLRRDYTGVEKLPGKERFSIKKEIKVNREIYAGIIRQQENLRAEPENNQIFVLRDKIADTQARIEYNENLLKSGNIPGRGIFTQSITPEDNSDVSITYSRMVSTRPILRNTEVIQYMKDIGPIETGFGDVVDYSAVPNADLVPDINRRQDCADAQMTLNALHQVEKVRLGEADAVAFDIIDNRGQTRRLEYRQDGTYTVWNGQTVVTKDYEGDFGGNFDDWLANIHGNVGTRQLPSIMDPVTEVDDLKPGDIIAKLHKGKAMGHTEAVLNLAESPPGSGNIVYTLFASSYPPTDPRLYSERMTKEGLRKLVASGDVALLRFPEIEEEKPVLVAAAE